jgi:hypothetical protein
MSKPSPLKLDPFTIGAVVSTVGSLAKLGISLAGAGRRRDEQRAAREEMEEYRTKYEELDTSNLYANVSNQFENMENAFEDLTVNKQQAEFERNMAQQQQANIMQQMGGAAGASGIASLAQAMANQGLIQAQRAGASIGAQESQIGIRRAAEASRLQQMERRGEQFAETQRLRGAETSRGLEWGKTSTLLGMSQERYAGANEAIRQAKADQMAALGNLASTGTSMMTGVPSKREKPPVVDTTEKGKAYNIPIADRHLNESGIVTPYRPFDDPGFYGKEIDIPTYPNMMPWLEEEPYIKSPFGKRKRKNK